MSLTFTAAVRANKPKRNVQFIEAGSIFSMALQKNGKAWGWGNNGYGQIGDNTVVSKRTPVSVAGAAKTFCKISATYAHTMAIDKNGRAWGWGYNQAGGLGNNSLTAVLTPTSVLGAVKTFCKIATGLYTTHAIDKNGRLWGWGGGYYGAVGDNSVTNRLTPVSVLGAVKTFCEISASAWYHTMAIDKNGRLWGWGYNSRGAIGDNTVVSKRTPVSVAGAAKTFCRVRAGFLYTVAIDKNGRAWAWGDASAGVLGDNSVVSKRTPVSVAGAIKTFCKISAHFHTLAIDKNGRAWAWGYNSGGELGDGTLVSRLTPVSVAGAIKTFCEISAGGGGHSLAIDKNGRAWAWGNGLDGILGDNSIVDKTTPVRICNI